MGLLPYSVHQQVMPKRAGKFIKDHLFLFGIFFKVL